MPFAPIKLTPGVNTEQTPTLLQAGFSQSQLIRFRDGLVEKIGGWVKYFPFLLNGVPRWMHAWQDINGIDHLAVGTTTELDIITSGAETSITPQTKTTDFAPKISTTSGSATVTIDDSNIANIGTFDSVSFNTPIAIGGLIMSGQYAVTLNTGTTTYQITAKSSATATVATATITGATMANPCVVTAVAHGFSNGQLIYIAGVAGMTQINGLIFTVAGVTANTFQLSGIDSSAYTAYSSGGFAYGATVPQFDTTSGSSSVTVTLAGHGRAVGDPVVFPISTTVGGISISGTYSVVTLLSSSTFKITASSGASSTATALMNSGSCELVYYIALGPQQVGAGYGLGTYGTGTYGLGTSSSAQTGTPITVTDWSIDNWGEIIMANPAGGGLYAWSPTGGFTTASLITTGPLFANSMFVAMPAQILVALGATVDYRVGNVGIGVAQDPLLISWSDQENYNTWTASATTQAGSYHVPTGSKIMGGLQAPQQGLIWTDIDLWSMKYVGQPLVFAFTKIGSSCGLIARHAARVSNGVAYWMGSNDFYMSNGGVVKSLSCPVWDAVYEQLNDAQVDKCWCWMNDPFDEVWWFYPTGTNTQCDSYVKFNVGDNVWDYGTLGRTCGIGQTVLGNPIAAASNGTIYQHEEGYDADGAPLSWSFTTGDMVLQDGENFAFLDMFIPDMKWGLFNGTQNASVQITFNVRNYPGQAYTTFGPYTLTSDLTAITPRLRGRQMSITMSGSDTGSFTRMGLPRARISMDGRQ